MATLLPPTDRPPIPEPGFETDVLRHVERLASRLPPDKALLHIGRVPRHPDWPNPYFELRPVKSTAAGLRGTAVQGDLNLTIGEAAWREFCGFERGGTVIKGATWQQEFEWIWIAVTAGGFTEDVYYASGGRVIGWEARLPVHGTGVVFRNGRRRRSLFSKMEKKTFVYQAYV